MAKILVTGGCGYIGSHTIVDLIENGYEVISIDNLSRGFQELNKGINAIVKKEVKNYNIDLCNLGDLGAVFEENTDIEGIIHFAAYKSVPESVDKPLMYFDNNLGSLINILKCVADYNVKHFVFSSSCSVYGNAEKLPVTEETPFQKAESPYASTKVMGEDICSRFAIAHPTFKVILLRYFNPAGAHPSCLIGEYNEKPENLVPVITQTAIGIRKEMTVFGTDYSTRDGSCIRDYIHVSDIAHAHTLAIDKSMENTLASNCEVFNLGTGEGVTVLELIHTFEKVTGMKLPYQLGDRRAGDVVEIFANNEKAKSELGWTPKYNVTDMMTTAWEWEKYLKHLKSAFLN